jgi:bifunctional non-homologous end joining protein LigD
MIEVTFDGCRLLARCVGDHVALITRNGNDWTAKLPKLRQTLEKPGLPPGWYDAENVVNDARGHPDFGALQRAFDVENTREIVYCLFDVAYFDGHDLWGQPVWARRARLQGVLEKLPASPLLWDELDKWKAGDQWTVSNVHSRLDVDNAPGLAMRAARGASTGP